MYKISDHHVMYLKLTSQFLSIFKKSINLAHSLKKEKTYLGDWHLETLI